MPVMMTAPRIVLSEVVVDGEDMVAGDKEGQTRSTSIPGPETDRSYLLFKEYALPVMETKLANGLEGSHQTYARLLAGSNLMGSSGLARTETGREERRRQTASFQDFTVCFGNLRCGYQTNPVRQTHVG